MAVFRYKWALSGLLALLMALAGYRAVHLLCPNWWLPASAAVFQHPATVQRIDPHIYDGQWFDAARAGRTDITQALLNAGFPVNSRTDSGYTALVLATYHGALDEVTLLLGFGADPCIPDHNGNTALMGALFKGEMTVAEHLIDLCPIDATNNAGQTALSFAALFGRLDILPVLARKGADLDHLDAKGESARTIVKQQGNDAAVAALDALGAMH